MAAKIQITQGTKAALGARVTPVGMPFLLTDTMEFGVGDGVSACDALVQGVQAYETIAAATPSGSLSITFAANRRQYTGNVAVTGGSVDFTDKIVLPAAGRRTGDAAKFLVAMPANSHPTISFHPLTEGAGALATIAPDAGTARTYLAEFVYDGTTWVFLDLRQRI